MTLEEMKSSRKDSIIDYLLLLARAKEDSADGPVDVPFIWAVLHAYLISTGAMVLSVMTIDEDDQWPMPRWHCRKCHAWHLQSAVGEP